MPALRRPTWVWVLVVAVAALLILMWATHPPVFRPGFGGTPEETTRVQLEIYADAIMKYERTEGRYPESLEALLDSPMFDLYEESRRRAALQDHWGSPYVYERGAGEVTLRSAGPDRAMGTSDDIVVKVRPFQETSK